MKTLKISISTVGGGGYFYYKNYASEDDLIKIKDDILKRLKDEDFFETGRLFPNEVFYINIVNIIAVEFTENYKR